MGAQPSWAVEVGHGNAGGSGGKSSTDRLMAAATDATFDLDRFPEA